MDTPTAGQRWVSDTEPELGLGVVLKCAFGRLEVYFPAASEHRQYALASAPLRRVKFEVGDTIQSQNHARHVVTDVILDDAGLLTYRSDSDTIPEALLADTISFSKPQDRLFAKQVDDPRTHDLRLRALQHRCIARKSPVRGFVGARIDLIPHQLAIASEVSSRLLPRVLLADEVGLGKTIEACLIMHRLHLTGRADRVLILVPEPLLHQWFVELLRRFNLRFSLFDEERCAAIEQHDPDANPFLDSQLILTSLDLLTSQAKRSRQAVESGWDLLIVDEAHHLEWHPEKPSHAYQIVENLAAHTAGILLLSATPQQLGADGHFARLRLLDPQRFSDLDTFIEETRHYEEVAAAIDRLLTVGKLSAKEKKLFASRSERVRAHLDAALSGDAEAKSSLISSLIDEFGTGRVMFRNTRRVLTGFPERRLHLAPLNPSLATPDEPIKPLTNWLASFLRDNPTAKVLAITHSAEMAAQIHEGLLTQIQVHSELFHEGLSLLQRDRHAASFAEPDGARILICSEIGSEGRNFQFAHHLVLLDLPDNVEVLEQRIGRLDRIGQSETIHIHVPFLPQSRTEALALLFHQGLDAFEHTVHGAAEIGREISETVCTLSDDFSSAKLKGLIQKTQVTYAKIQQKLGRGQDRLLELSSRPCENVATLLQQIQEMDRDRDFELFFIDLLDYFGLHVEELTDRDYFLHRGTLITDAFPALPEEGLSVTFDRHRALTREQLTFLTPDHPLVRSALDLLLGSEHGNVTFSVWRGTESDALLLECCFIAECAAPAALHVDRFLPATPIRIVVNHAFKNVTNKVDLTDAPLRRSRPDRLLDQTSIKTVVLPKMLRRAEEIANKRALELGAAGQAMMRKQLQEELARLRDLSEINHLVRPEEIAALSSQEAALASALETPQLRLDALRLIWCRQGDVSDA